jgi:hypothetical protein
MNVIQRVIGIFKKEQVKQVKQVKQLDFEMEEYIKSEWTSESWSSVNTEIKDYNTNFDNSSLYTIDLQA